jgi:hypothetical protein
MDKAKQAKDKLVESGKVDELAQKAEETAKKATGHKHDDQIEKGSDAVADTLQREPENRPER